MFVPVCYFKSRGKCSFGAKWTGAGGGGEKELGPLCCLILSGAHSPCTDKKKTKFSIIYKEIQIGLVAKSYMRQGFLIYEEMC